MELLILTVVIGLSLLLAPIPGAIARARGHANTDAIRICGWVGAVVWPAWVVALIWAFTVSAGGTASTGELDAAKQRLKIAGHYGILLAAIVVGTAIAFAIGVQFIH